MGEYGPASYGDAMADVYDEWYGPSADTEAAVVRLAALAGLAASARGGGPPRVLELGVGTGRLALPLATRHGCALDGVDASAAMLERLRAKPGAGAVGTVLGDMATDLPAGPYDLVFVATNTLFNLVDAGAQARCFAEVAARLAPHGRFVVEAFVPDPDPSTTEAVTVRSIGADHVVLGVSRHDAETQLAVGQFVELRDGEPVRLRPWKIRWATPEQLDRLAEAAGLRLVERWAGWDGEAFGPDSGRHVSVWARSSAGPPPQVASPS